MIDEKKRLESLAELRSSEGWQAFIEELAEARRMRHSAAVYELSTAEQLWTLKGWTECADAILEMTEAARGELEELENERDRKASGGAWH